MVAGTLYGLWAGRGVSGRRLKGIGPLLAPNTSAVVAWADGSVIDDAIAQWAKGSSDLLSLRFVPVKGGAALIDRWLRDASTFAFPGRGADGCPEQRRCCTVVPQRRRV